MTAAASGARPDKLGVLGGMGPLATVDFLRKLIALTPAVADDQHIPVVVTSEPQIPPRPAARLDPGNPSPLPALLARRDFLVGAGARAIAMPCNTAHFWYDELTDGLAIPFLHIVDAVIAMLDKRGLGGATIGLVGTRATLEGRLYEAPLTAEGFPCLCPEQAINEELVWPGVKLVKRNKPTDAGPLFRRAVESLLDRGAATVVLACTEVPVGLPTTDPWVSAHCLDPNEALAQACVDWALAARKGAGLV
jgi:aspartate racemase